ncbi:hypothetical protein WJX72_010467 [[Myrmecia] bisecta]|uniref:Uncharacterized protein n=1 Tax=[Myrmecia] bisecta TaxID=41462 RepID=A0AAW1PQ74_9CHLO
MSITPGGRERELQALLKQKDAELEERGKLLYKTKVAIEQLQQELAASRREEETIKEEARKAYEDQAAQLRAVQQQLHLTEDELTVRNQELSRYAADSQATQGRLTELEEELETAKEEAAQHTALLQAKLREQERTNEAQAEDIDGQQTQLTSLEALLREKASLLAESQDRLEQVQQEREDSDRLVRELMQKSKRVQDEKQSAEDSLRAAQDTIEQQEKQLAAAHAAALAAQKERTALERDWNRRYQRLETDGAKRLQDAEQMWPKRLEDRERQLAGEREELERVLKKRADEAEAACQRRLEEMRQVLEKKLEGAEWKAASEKSLVERQWSAKLEETEKCWAEEKAVAEQTWAAAKADAEQQWRQTLQDLQQHWTQERAEMEHVSQERVAAAERGQDALRHDLDSKVSAITARLLLMVRKEAKREKKRGELMRQMEEVRVRGEEEHGKRVELEMALREAAAIFKRELFDKNEELASLQAELSLQAPHMVEVGASGPDWPARTVWQSHGGSQGAGGTRQMRDWQSQSLDNVTRDLHSRQGTALLRDSLAGQPSSPYGHMASASPASPHIRASTGRMHSQLPPFVPAHLNGLTPVSVRASTGLLFQTPLSPSAKHHADVERELRSLRKEREEFQKQILTQEQLRNSLLSRIQQTMEGHSSSKRLTRSASASRTRRKAGTSQAAIGSKTSFSQRGHDSLPPDLQTWNEELSLRLGEAMKKLEPSMSHGHEALSAGEDS